MYISNKKCVIGTMNRRVRAKRTLTCKGMGGTQRYFLEIKVLVQQEMKNKLTTRFEPSPYTVVNKHWNSLIVQSPGGAQYSRNTSHVRKLLENGDTHADTPSIPEVVVTGEPHKQDKLTPEQSVVIPEQNVVEPKVPLRRSQRHRVAPSYVKDYWT